MSRTGFFISHAHADSELAESLATLLETALSLAPGDITCTSDPERGLTRGGDLREEITARLKNAKASFLLATSASRQQEWVAFESGIADGFKDDGLEFYVVTPFSVPKEAVPEMFSDRVAVALCRAEDVHAFIKQLRQRFHAVPAADYADRLVDLIDRAARLEQARQQRAYDAQSEQVRRLGKRMNVLTGAAGLLALATAASLAWTGSLERAYAKERDRLQDQSSQQSLKYEEISARNVSDLEKQFKGFGLSGRFYDGQQAVVRCSRVVANVEEDGAERSVSKDCDGSGTFTFSAPELQYDARRAVRLIVHDTAGRPHELPVRLADARLALQLDAP